MKDIASKWPNSSSGFYTIVNAHGESTNVYCHMDQLCGVDESWTRVAFLNMTDPTESCPSGFKLYNHGNIRACGKDNSGCLSTFFHPNISYTKVCGRVRGYQFGTPDSTWAGGTLDDPHFDGISITYGSPRKNLWAFIGAHQKGQQVCPCAAQPTRPVLPYIGNHYYCDSGSSLSPQFVFYTEPLWDGIGCVATDRACCQRPLIPWFYRNFSSPTTDAIELRDCSNQPSADEDTPMDQYEIYVA